MKVQPGLLLTRCDEYEKLFQSVASLEQVVNYLTVLTLTLLAIAVPVHSESAKATLVAGAGTDQTCPTQLPNGTNYEVHFRTLKVNWKNRVVFVTVKAYYKPDSGEFFYESAIISKEGYLRDFRQRPIRTCKPTEGHIVLLENGEWADFSASNRLDVYHSTLQFATIGKAWQYVSTHFEECHKCWEEIPL